METGELLYNRYRIEDTLGRGGMGAVYRAVDESLGVAVAVKENLFSDEEYARQFRSEAIILANLRHPNLPRVTDHFVIPNQGQYLVMDYIEGEDLGQWLDRVGVLRENEAILVGVAILDALGYMHALNPPVLHRDIKPGNIKITSKGLVYLVDFGLAKIVRGSAKTATGAQGLTPGFSPPEQYGTARTDARSDIYSLGATLYKALTGSSPEDSLSRMMHQTELVSIRDRNPKISLQLSACIALALDVIPDERYQTAGEFRSALLQLSEAAQQQVAGGSITIPVDAFQADLAKTVKSSQAAEALTRGAGSEAGQAKKKSGAAWKWIAGLAFGVLGAYILLPGLFSTPPPPATPTSEITAVPSPDAAQGALGDASPQVIATPVPPVDATPTTAPTPTGSGGRIAFASFRPDRSNTGLPQVWLVNVAGGDLFQLTDEVGGACQPDWSPDGSKLVFVSPCEANQETYPGASLFVINADGSGRTALPTFLGGDFDPTWSPDGSKIAFTSIRGDRRRQIWLLDIASGAVTNISASVATDFQPAWSPDGAMLLFVTNRAGPTQVWFMDISGRPWDVFSRSNDKSNTDPVWSPDGSIILFTQRNSENQIGLTAALWENGGVNRGFNEFYIISDERQRNRYQMREVDFSPDGFWLVSAANPERNNFDLYIMTATGSQLTRLTTDPADDFDPAWQPAQ